jgi:OPA family glycerol-3-phosphate transporter-like MFS transporter/OPA family sugar phosphate sensor protein UhpC-like MFS transporter
MGTTEIENGVFSGMSTSELKRFKSWQKRTILVSMIGYAMFYFVRKNLSIALPFMNEDLGISKTDLGLFLTLHGLIYGLSKFINGYLGDRSNARYFMVTGLVLSAIMNLFFGFSSAVVTLGLFWMLNGWFQGMGFPPCARLLTHWVPPKELATKMSVWNTSHSIGAGLVVISCGYIVSMDWAWSGLAAWRWCFFLPAALALLGALFLWVFLRDTPRSVGLPEMNLGKSGAIQDNSSSKEFRSFVLKQVFKNPAIWILGVANFFVYSIRYAVLDWGPTMLKEHLNMDISHAGWTVAAFEIAGISGMLAAGWLTDKVFRGRGARYCVFAMALTALALFLLRLLNVESPMWLAVLILIMAGFFIYGPQALVGISVANMATKNAAATAVGFTGLFGYLSTIVSGWGVGMLVEELGWDFTFGVLIALTLVGMFVFLLAWRYRADGYENS